MFPNALKSCPKFNKSPNLVTLLLTESCFTAARIPIPNWNYYVTQISSNRRKIRFFETIQSHENVGGFFSNRIAKHISHQTISNSVRLIIERQRFEHVLSVEGNHGQSSSQIPVLMLIRQTKGTTRYSSG